jgi:hypothetical protein
MLYGASDVVRVSLMLTGFFCQKTKMLVLPVGEQILRGLAKKVHRLHDGFEILVYFAFDHSVFGEREHTCAIPG